MKPFVKKIIKPWGYELIFTRDYSPVTSKVLHLNAGARFSYQYHEEKKECLVLLRGEAKIILDGQEFLMSKLKGYYIEPMTKHRCWGITACDILESSTKETGKTVRLEDDYKRGDEIDKSRQLRDKAGVYLG